MKTSTQPIDGPTDAPSWAELRLMFKESGERAEKEMQEVRASQKEASKMFKESREQMREFVREQMQEVAASQKETDRLIKEMSKEINGISNSNGEFAEEHFYLAFEQDPTLGNIHFNIVDKNVRPPLVKNADEYDIVLANDKNVAIIETKYKLRKEDVGQVIKKAETFRHWFPQYSKHKIYLGLASLITIRNATAEAEAKRQGIALIRQRGGKVIVHDENLKAY
jgi:ElaB/YqjD/DUF883 family membrane-anchored ribosome-binding protein